MVAAESMEGALGPVLSSDLGDDRNRAAELAAIIEAIADPVLVATAAGRIRVANRAAVAWFGSPALVSYGQVLARLEDPASAPIPGRAVREEPLELKLRGEDRWIELTTYPAPPAPSVDETAEPGWATIVIVRDVTDLRHARQLRDAFIGVLSHELRTPITTIYAGSRVLARPDLAEEMRREVAFDVQAEAERLHRLAEDLLVLARAERGRLDIGGDPVLLQHVLPGVVSSEQARWPDTQFEASVPPGLLPVAAEQTYVEQVARNLLANAAKYAPVGTTVELVAESGREEVRVRILDEGPGFADDEARRLFDLFYRSPRAEASSTGAGIGLFVCRALVGAMGGRIWAIPRAAGGAEFGFSLPVLDEDAG